MNSILVFADGASRGNPGPGGWGAIIVTPEGQVTELGGAEPETTNNRMELMGVIGALSRLAQTPGTVDIHTDSTYVIRGITQWVWGWRNRGWKTAEGKDVANPDLWKRLMALVAERGKANPIEWKYVAGHKGIPGNERVDEIAVAFATGRNAHLYRGPLLKYDVAIHDIPENTSLPEMKPKAEAKAPAYSYLSVVNGVLERHSSWPDCERRVKGRPGAKFKKAMNAGDEEQILKSWGFSSSQLRK